MVREREPNASAGAACAAFAAGVLDTFIRVVPWVSLNANSPPNPKRTFPAKRGVAPARHGTSGFNDACAPSNDKDTRTLLGALAALGYVMVAPDSIGLRAFGGATGFPPYLVLTIGIISPQWHAPRSQAK